MKRSFVTTSIGVAGVCALLLVPLESCTNVDEVPPSSVSPGTFFRTQAEVLAALAGVYSQLRSTLDDYYDASEISTDEMVVPTRGQDWYDGGSWLDLHRQTFTATSPATGGLLNGAFNTMMGGIARANVLLDGLQSSSVPGKAGIQAEAQALRALYYYFLMDFFGGVPLATTSELKQRPRVTRDSLFRFIESELLAVRAALPAPDTLGPSHIGRMTKGAVDAILANMYLNAGVFKKDGAAGGINPAAYNTCRGVTVSGGIDACQAASDRADSILNSGRYSLATAFSDAFKAGNATSKENIFVVKFIAADGLGLNFVMRLLHYNQFTPSPWNGFATLAQAYNTFDSLDQRRKIFLVGPQVNVLTGASVKDRAGNPLVFTTSIANVTQATEAEGARVYKWPADPNHVAQNNGNDYAWFRLGEIYLIKAEAQNEITPGSPTALTLVNNLRARDFNPAKPLATIDRPTILNERLFELVGEGKRRQDLIRFGLYTAPNAYKAQTTPNYVLMPIPQVQLDANPLIKQNPGY
jgi:hypothetical protein